jgi:3-isopropylmalate dehydrogenase
MRHIGVIAGGCVGPDIIKATISCLDAVANASGTRFCYEFYSGPAPSQDVALTEAYPRLKDFYQSTKDRNGVVLRASLYASLVYKLREDFNLLYKLVCLEPVSELLDVSPLKNDVAERIRFLLVRDNAQGLYHGQEETGLSPDGGRSVTITSRYDESKIRAVARVAFRLAAQGRKSVELLIKGDVLRQLAALWLDVFESTRADFPDVEFDWDHPDPGLANIITSPSRYDVVVALDVDADIISDFVSALLYGSRAITPSGNFDPDSGFATYQTIHGSADSLTGQNKANPIGMIMAGAMMLEHSFGMSGEASWIRSAVRNVLSRGFRTLDIMKRGSSDNTLVGTSEMTQLIVDAIKNAGGSRATA